MRVCACVCACVHVCARYERTIKVLCVHPSLLLPVSQIYSTVHSIHHRSVNHERTAEEYSREREALLKKLAGVSTCPTMT